MKNFIIVMLIITTINIIIQIVFLMCNEYPRKSEWKASEDVLGILIKCGIMFWGLNILGFI
ncbi:unnamed protein product [marine sediment metagenome]|uniref:Uncharacterized protein n=1 Tax=marine sediment metagenome TaxID=412755 RepID=X0XY11_9ZZZZ